MAPNTVIDVQSLQNAETAPISSSIEQDVQVSFSHVHLYVDHVDDLAVYKELEGRLTNNECINDDAPFCSQNRDIVKQLLAGFGFRVTGSRMSPQSTASNTRTVLVTSKDPKGVQFVVTAVDPDSTLQQDEMRHFDAANVTHFFAQHSGRQGIAVLGFQANSVEAIQTKYLKLHPKLVLGDIYTYENAKVLEVYAYYKGESSESGVDTGTVLRFVESLNENSSAGECLLPGLEPVSAQFQDDSQAAYCDHWVSNGTYENIELEIVLHALYLMNHLAVYSRTGFLKTLEETLGFNPKVDFNAGVVAAGEAQIESTVTGNTSTAIVSDTEAALKDQSQVYLPINNALSEVGHVHGFLEELGQGIQHIASRVENLIDFVQQGNDRREQFGELTSSDSECAGVSDKCAAAVMNVCRECNIVGPDGAVDLDLSREEIDNLMCTNLHGDELKEYVSHEAAVLETILHSRYVNLYKLLRHHLSEESYLGLVRNQILVDVQGDDLLYQIFTSNILQRNVGEESPFLEFIQRVCSECKDEDGCPVKLKPGCGGFGIRNFLTLFLSIEVSKSMLEVSEARKAGDTARCEYAQSMVDCFTNQLNESNPILTEISDAMTEEGHCRDKLENATTEEDVEMWKAKMEQAASAKQAGNEKLMECSSKYKELMKAIREGRARDLGE